MRTPHIFAPLFERKKRPFAGVAKLADAPDLGSGAVRHGGSSPSARTLKNGVLMIFDEQLPFLSSHQFTFFVFIIT